MKQITSTKFLGVQIDENIHWDQQIEHNAMFQGKKLLEFKSLVLFYSYLNYADIAWASTKRTQQKNVFSIQMQVC